ncbi:helix-turn-helix domain-containing protein [Gordonia soli]|uniref:helix-turn-helix domain-containing protein n=1 Tax=Gordonia soli TaxID=320799 RepID=UPI0012F9862E|nr:helix-turn-helix transcriptional regulator [Gordonia soli]
MIGAGDELGRFLRARRAELSPTDVGLPESLGVRRRVQGLRREEVAQLAGISTDYYSRIEQGRRTPPWGTLDAISRGLRIDEAGRNYVFALISADAAPPRQRRAQRVPAHLQRVLDDLHLVPAVILGRRMDILAWNRLAAVVITDFDALPSRRRNWVHLTFTSSAVRALYPDWPTVARQCVAQLHLEAGRNPHDRQLTELVGELSVLDPDFRRWWSDHHVALRTRGTKRLLHPAVGELILDWDTVIWSGDPELQLISWTAESGTPTYDRLNQLAAHRPDER